MELPRRAHPVMLAGLLVLVAACSVAGGGTSSAMPSSHGVSPEPSSPSRSAVPTEPAAPPRWTVSELLAARAAGDLSGGPHLLTGYWTNRLVGHSCSPPAAPPGELEIRCHDGEYGITERNEPVGVLTGDSRWVPTDGPMLTPWLPNDLHHELELPWINDQPYPPVPIVVRGHLDDPRAAECQPAARQLCEDRFVVEDIVEFDPAAVPTPGVSPTPSPFPFDSPPPAPFEAPTCHIPGEPPPASFTHVGWIDVAELELTSQRAFRGQTVYAVIVEDPVRLGEWFRVEGDDQDSLPMGRLVCIAEENDGTVMSFDSVAGSAYRVYRDGSTAPPR